MALTLDEEYDLLAGAKQIDQEAATQLSLDREYDLLVSGGNKDYVASKDIQRIPQQINALGGLPVGGEPMVGGPDILAQEQGQTKTFMEGPDGKPVEVRRAQAIDISGKVITEPISPDGMDLQFRGDLIKQKTDELKSTFKLPFKEYRQKSDLLRSDIQTLKQKQQEHESKQIDWLTKLVTEKSGVSVPIETGIGQEYALDETKGKTQEVPIGTRKGKAQQIIRDKNLMIDDIIGNDKFINYALDKNLIAPQFSKYLSGTERLAGKLLNEGESADVIESLKRDPKIRELAEQWALTTPTFMQSAGSIFQNAWDSYSQTLGSSNVGAVGLALESLGATQLGKSLVEAADYADQQRKAGQDPRKVNEYIQFAKDVSGGIGSSSAFLVTGLLGRSMMSTLGVTSEKAVNILTKGNILTFGGLTSAWQGYSEARNDGATDEQAKQVALFSAMTQAPLELLSPLEKWVGKLDKNSQSRIYKGLSKAAEAIIDGADEAFFNEAPQQIAGNLVKKYVYAPNQDIFEGAGYSATTGGAAGVMTSVLVNMISGKRNKAAQKTGNPNEIEKQDVETESDKVAEELSVNPISDAAARMTKIDQQRSDLQEQISSDEELLQQYEEGSEDRKIAERAINQKRIDLENLNKQFDEAASGVPSKPTVQVSETITPPDSKEAIQTRIEELNKEFDALDEADIKGQDRVNQAIFAEQNKLAELTAIKQGIEPQGTTPTREMGLPPSGRRSEFGTFFPDRPVLQAFVKATDKVLGAIQTTSKRAQKLKNAIRTGIAANAGFLAGTNTEVISSEEYGKLTGGKQVAADTGTYRAVFLNGKKYLVVPNINQLAGISIEGEQQVATRDAALDQESRATAKKLEEEMIHLSMFQGIQDEYKGIKKPKLTEQEYIVKRISDIAKEVKRTNPNALPGVSNAYLNDKTKLLDDLTFSQEFMRMVIQRVRTGQITEDLNAIRAAEKEAFSDKDKGLIIAWKNSILNALQFARNSITRYLGKGTSTKEVKKMEDTINSILDGYGIVKGEANYEFKDYSKAEPTGKESLTVQPALPDRTISDAIKDKDTFVFEGMRGAISLEDGTVVFREFGTNNKYQVPVNPNQNISEISGIEWVRKGQTRNIPAEPTTEVAAIIESDPQISEEEVNAEQDDFQVPQALVEIEKSQVLNYIAEVLNTGESKIVKDGKRKQKVSQTPEFYSQITPKQIELANRQIDTALRIIDGLPISDEQKQSLAEPYLLIYQDITSYENNPEYKQIKASKRREVFPTDQAVALPEAGGQVEAVSETITPAIEAKAGVTPQMDADYLAAVESGDMDTAQRMVDEAASKNPLLELALAASKTDSNAFKSDEEYISYWENLFPEAFKETDKEKLNIANDVSDNAYSNFLEDAKKLNSTQDELNQLIQDATYKQNNFSPYKKDAQLKTIPLSQRFDVTSPIIARAGVTPNAQYSQAIKGDNGNDTITPKTNQETWENNNPESASKINSLILQRVREVGHLWKGSVKMPMFKAASKDFKSADGEVGSFFAETKEHAMSYLERGGKIFSAYIKMDNPANSSDVVRVLSKAFPQYAEEFRSDKGDWGSVMSTGGINDGAKFVEAMQDAGYDGVYQWDGADSVAVVFNPNQAKSADLATFNSKGQVIPISERFNPESPLIARAGVTPKPSAKMSKIEREVTQQVIDDIESMINDLDTGKDTSGKAYESKTAQKGKKYAYSLVSPFSQAINLFTTTTHKESLNAFNKVLKGNPDASFFDIASNLTLRDVNGQMVVTYGLTPTELSNLIPLLRVVAPTYRQMIMDSDASFADRTRIALNMPAIEYGLSKATAVLTQTGSRILNAAKIMRQFGGYGFAVANYKSKVVESIGGLWSKVGGDMADVAEAVRGDRRKAVDNVFNLSRMISKAVSLQKMAVRNPEKARQSIRNAISKKQNRKTKEILLEFCANTFGEDTEKYANMIIDQTAQEILAIGSGRKNVSVDVTYKKIYNAISAVAKQTAQEEQKKQEGNKKREVKPREGKFLQQVGMVIGNDKTYKQFMDELKNSIRREYQSDAAFNKDYKELFDKLSTRQWSEGMRTQAIKDSADALNYKFADLFSYIGSKRTGAQADVKAHITSELKDTGASQEMIDKFISDVDGYLNAETMRVIEKNLGFEINKDTGKIKGGKVIKENMRSLSTAEGQFKFAKTLKGLTRLAASDQRNFLDKLNELIITELGFDEATSNELSKYIDNEISNAIIQQQSNNLKEALDRANKKLADNNIKRVGTQRTLLKRLIEMANMGQLDDMKVYEAFRQTHNFSKGYLEYNPEFVQTLREWGDRISSLPEGVLRGIEEQKLGRLMLEKGVFTTTDYLSSYWYFSLLSQTGTQAMNVLGSTFNLLGNMAVWATYTKGKSIFPMMKALNRAITGKQSPASNAFLYVMQTGLNPSGLQDEKMMIQPKGNLFENATPENTPKLVYNMITFGGGNVKALTPALNSILNNISPRAMMRFMKATDAYMREVAYEVRASSLGASEFSQEQFDAAMRQAEKEMQGSKSNPKEKKRETIIRANEIIANQRLEVVKREYAEQDALEVIYGQKTAGFIGWLASIANKALEVYPVTRLFIPFTNVCANVLNENLNYAPLISQYRLISAVKLSPLLKGKIELRSGAEKNPFVQGRSDKAAEIAIKSSIGLVASALPFIVSALAGGDDEDQEKERPFIQFYSQGPKDPEQNKIWSENGGIKYSIRVGNTYISYLYTPLVIPLSYGQMLKESADEIKKKAGKDKAGDISELMIKALAAAPAIGFVAALDQSFLTGVSDLIELKEAKDIPKAGAGIIRNIVSRMIAPGVARDMQKLMIDEKLEGDLYITNMLKEFPGSSAFLDKDLNYFGDPARYNSIMQENGFTRRAFSLIGRITSSENPDPAFEILYKNGITPPKWNQSLQWFDKTPMNKAEQREFVRAAGPLMRQFIIDNESTIEQIQDTETAQKFISNGISAIRAGVKGQLQAERQ